MLVFKESNEDISKELLNKLIRSRLKGETIVYGNTDLKGGKYDGIKMKGDTYLLDSKEDREKLLNYWVPEDAEELSILLEGLLPEGMYKMGDEYFVAHTGKIGYIDYILSIGDKLGYQEAWQLFKNKKL